MCTFIKELCIKSANISEVNSSDLFLIPKVDNPQYVHHFRPISLCNSIYKVFSKIIINILNSCMDRFVYLNQTGYIPRRNIHDNIMVTQEILHSMHKLKARRAFLPSK